MSSPRSTTSWHGADRTRRGGADRSWPTLPSASFSPPMPRGSSGLSSSAMRCTDLVQVVDAQGARHPALRAERVDQQAASGPASGSRTAARDRVRAATRCTMPVTSRCGSTGAATRARSPSRSSAATNSCRSAKATTQVSLLGASYPPPHGRGCCSSRTTPRSARRSSARCAITATSSPRSVRACPRCPPPSSRSRTSCCSTSACPTSTAPTCCRCCAASATFP